MQRFPFFFFSFPFESDCSGPAEAGDSLDPSAWAAGLFFFVSPLLALSSPTVADSLDPPSVITEQQADGRKASSEAALSSRAAASALFRRSASSLPGVARGAPSCVCECAEQRF